MSGFEKMTEVEIGKQRREDAHKAKMLFYEYQIQMRKEGIEPSMVGFDTWLRFQEVKEIYVNEDQDFPTSKKKACTMLLDHIISRLPKDGVQMEILHDDLKRLRELINE